MCKPSIILGRYKLSPYTYYYQSTTLSYAKFFVSMTFTENNRSHKVFIYLFIFIFYVGDDELG